MGSTVEGVIDLLRLCCVVGVTNTDILKLCGVHIDLMCPNKMWSTIILYLPVKVLQVTAMTRLHCQLQFNQIKTCLLWFHSDPFVRILLLHDLWKRFSKVN